MKSLACTFVCLLLAASVAQAQGVGTSGDITGTVVDSVGAVLPGVTISVVDTQTGLKRTVASDGAGQYRVAGLSPSTYDVSAAQFGFATDLRKSVHVAIGQTVISDFRMKPAKVATVIEVTSEPPVVETERGSQADRISQEYIAGLPIDRRDYLTFTLLAPGVSDSSRLAGDQDFRVKQTPQSGLSFYGSNGRGNDITVDGGETSGDSGGVRLTVTRCTSKCCSIGRQARRTIRTASISRTTAAMFTPDHFESGVFTNSTVPRTHQPSTAQRSIRASILPVFLPTPLSLHAAMPRDNRSLASRTAGIANSSRS